MRNDIFLYNEFPEGKRLRRVIAGTLNRPFEPETSQIPAGGWTELISGGDCKELIFTFKSLVGAGTSPGSPIALIEQSRTPNATLSADINTYAAINVTTNWSVLTWSMGQARPGYFRFKNMHGGDVMEVYVQKLLR